MTWVTSLGAVVALVAGALALVFLLFPDAKPEASGPRTSAASLAPVDFDPSITRAQYLARIDEQPVGFTPAQLRQRGALVLYRVTPTGLEGVPLTLKHELIDARTKDELSEDRSTTITPTENEIPRNWHYWAELPRGGRYYMVVEMLMEGEPAPLDTLRTRTFPGLLPAAG
jgi:hypothetical protein